METISIKLKINNHYETLCLRKLYREWNEDQLKSYNFSKSQLVRIKSHFEQHLSNLTMTNNITPQKSSEELIKSSADNQVLVKVTTTPSLDSIDLIDTRFNRSKGMTGITGSATGQNCPVALSPVNLDVYIESDFDQYIPTFSNKFYYQQLFDAITMAKSKNVLHYN